MTKLASLCKISYNVTGKLDSKNKSRGTLHMNTSWKKILSTVLACGLLAGSLPASALTEETPAVAVETPAPQAETPPTETATAEPTEAPAEAPTAESTESPTEAPTSEPTETPTEVPTEAPAPVPAAVSDQLIILSKMDLSDVSLGGYLSVLVESSGEITGGTVDLPVENHGVISGGIFNETVSNEAGGCIREGTFNGKLYNREDARIEKGAFNGEIHNFGVIANGKFIGYTPIDDDDPVPARTVLVFNEGAIQNGEFKICKVSNNSDGAITGGSFDAPVILPNGITAALDFENVHEKLVGGILYYLPLRIHALLDEEKNEIVLMPLNPTEKLLGYTLSVQCGAAQYELSGDWNAASDGYVHIPVQAEWQGGKAQASVGYLSSVNALEAAAVAELTLPGAEFTFSAELDYVNESVLLRTDTPLGAGWKLIVSPMPQQAVDYVEAAADTAVTLDWPADVSEMQCTLSELNASPDAAASDRYGLQLQLISADASASSILTLTMPARADFSNKATKLKGNYLSPTELEIRCADGIETALALPNTAEGDLHAGSHYSGLSENTIYHIWVRDAAITGTSFASKWKLAATTTTQAITDVSFTPSSLTVHWKPKASTPKLTFDGGNLKASDLIFDWVNEQGESGNGVPTELGNYQILCSLKESKAKWYRLRTTTLEYNVVPLEMTNSNTRVSCDNLLYSGKEQLPQDLEITIGGVNIPQKEFTVSKIKGQDYISTGVKKLRLTGKGNVSGSIDFSYTVYAASGGSSWGSADDISGANENEPEGEVADTEPIDYVSDNGERLCNAYLGVEDALSDLSQVLIVYDAQNEPADYELLPVYLSAEESDDPAAENENLLIVTAQPNDEGQYAPRSLRLRLDQIQRLHEEGNFAFLLFRNGDGESKLRLDELLGGDIFKLAMCMLNTQESSLDPASLDLESMADALLTDAQLAQVSLAVSIEPVALPNSLEAWSAAAYLEKGDLRVNISSLLPNFRIGMNVNGLFEEGEESAFAAGYALALVHMKNGENTVVQLESSLEVNPAHMQDENADTCEYFSVHMPTEQDPEVLVDYIANATIEAYRNYILSSPYSGEGAYLAVKLS